MDTLDVRIVGHLLGVEGGAPGIRRSFRSIARDLDVDENTVRNRLSQLRRSGFLKGWLVTVNPTLVGEQVVQVWLDVPPGADKDRAIRDLTLVEGVGLILDYYGTALSVQLYFEENRTPAKTLALIGRIAGSNDLESARIAFPTPKMTLVRKDWRILLCLHRNPWEPFTKIAREVGGSSVTVKRRLAKMNRSEALYLLVDIDPKVTRGSLLAHLAVFYDSSDSRHVINERVSKTLREEIAFAELDNPDHGFFALMLTNVSRAREVIRWSAQLPGIRRARIDILQDIVTFPELHESLIQKGLRGSTNR